MGRLHVAGPVEHEQGGGVQRCLRCDRVLISSDGRELRVGERVALDGKRDCGNGLVDPLEGLVDPVRELA